MLNGYVKIVYYIVIQGIHINCRLSSIKLIGLCVTVWVNVNVWRLIRITWVNEILLYEGWYI
jgi:hypothetical protein